MPRPKVPGGPHGRRMAPHEMEERIRKKHEDNHNLMYRLDDALRKHGPDILPILDDIGTRSERGDAISIFAEEKDPKKAVRRIRELGIKPGKR